MTPVEPRDNTAARNGRPAQEEYWRTYFEDKAGRPDRHPDHGIVGYSSAVTALTYHRAARHAMGNPVGLRILDAGCGDGQVTGPLAATNPVIGADFSQAMAALARRRGLVPACADISRLPFTDGCFDIIVNVEVITLCSDPQRVLDEFCRVLAPGGRLVLTAMNDGSLVRRLVRLLMRITGSVHPNMLDPLAVQDRLARHGVPVTGTGWMVSGIHRALRPRSRFATAILRRLATNFIIVAQKPDP